MAPSPQTLDLGDRRVVAAWAADCAGQVLAIYERAVPGDRRVRAAIEQTRAFAAGTLDVGTAVRRRGADAGAAARDAPTPAARAAAYAAEQAAAVAHMGAHALGAAGYAATAAVLDTDGDDGAARSEAHRQVAGMTEDVARVLSALPALGADRRGPLGPGRLSLGNVGETIREIQRLLSDVEHAVVTVAELREAPPMSDAPATDHAIGRAMPQVFVTDLDRALGFYRDVLGFEVVYTYGEPVFYAEVARGDAALNLRFVDRVPFLPDVRETEQLLTTAVSVGDAASLFVEVEAKGADFHEHLCRKPWGSDEFVVRDPDGNLLLFGSRPH